MGCNGVGRLWSSCHLRKTHGVTPVVYVSVRRVFGVWSVRMSLVVVQSSVVEYVEKVLTEGGGGETPADHFTVSEHHAFSAELPESRQVHFLFIFY